MEEYHNRDVIFEYSYPQVELIKKPIILVGYVFALFILLLVYFKYFSKESEI